jgi:hypothetical protein
MLTRMWRYGLVALTMIALFATAQPAAAFTKTGQTGSVGSYKVYDSAGFAGVDCEYTGGNDPYEGELTRIWPYPPDVMARAGVGMQKVGWRYIVQRKLPGQGWSNRVTSRTYTATTDSSHPADLPYELSTRVIVPQGSSGSYRVLYTLFWYGADGRTVTGSVTGRIKYYRATFDIGDTLTRSGSCPDSY